MTALRLWSPEGGPLAAAIPAAASISQPAAPAPQTGGDIIRRYLDDLEVRKNAGDVSETHFDNYQRSLETAPRDEDGKARYVGFVEVIGDIPARELIQHNLTEWLARNPQWKSADTRRNNTAAVIACFNWADEEGLLKPAPYKRSKRLKEQKSVRRDASDEELRSIWETAGPALRKVLWIIDRVGLRTYEARALDFDKHILWDQSIIRFDQHKASRRQKRKAPRIVGLDSETLCELRRWREERRDRQTLVCLSKRGRAWSKNNLDKVFRIAREKAGLAADLVPYCFRHRFVTQTRLSGTSREDTAQQAGHASPNMTDDYTHLEDKPGFMAQVAANAVANAERIAAARASLNVKIALD